MSEEYQHVVKVNDFFGLDLTSNDLKRPDQFLSDGRNFDIDDNGDIVSKPGYKYVSETTITSLPMATSVFFGFGNSATGLLEGDLKTELVYLQGTTLKRVTNFKLNIELAVGNSRRIEVYWNVANARFQLRITNLGTAAVELDTTLSGGKTVGDLKAEIAAVVSDTSFNTEADSLLVANLKQMNIILVATSSVNLFLFKEEDVSKKNSIALTPGPQSRPAFINNVMYFTQRNDAGSNAGLLWKYDGICIHRAGLPKPSITLTEVSPADSGIGAGTYSYKMRIGLRDNAGNFVYGPFSDVKKITVASAKDVRITTNVNSVLGSSTGYKTGFATLTSNLSLVAGSNVATVSSGHSLAVGDVIAIPGSVQTASRAFTNEAVPTFLEDRVRFARVTAVGTTSVTFFIEADQLVGPNGGAYLGIDSGAVITAGYWLEFYRTRKTAVDPGQLTFFLLGQIPAANNVTSWTVDDEVVDTIGTQISDITSAIIAPRTPPDDGVTPAKVQYLTTYRGRLIAGDLKDGNLVHFSEAGFPENFPAATNSYLLDTELGDKLTGLSGNQDALLNFKDGTIHRVVGDLGGGFAVDRIWTGVGCISHASISEIGEQRTIFATKKGLYQVIKSSVVMPVMPIQGIGGESVDRLAKYFDSRHPSEEGDLTKRINQSIGSVWFDNNKYLLVIPRWIRRNAEFPTFTVRNHSYDIVIFDYKRGYYTIWNDMRTFGGFASYKHPDDFDKSLYFFVEQGPESGDLRSLAVIGDTKLPEDNLNNGAAITTTLKFNWMNLGSPDVFKKFIRGNMWVIGADPSTMTVTGEVDWIKDDICTSVALEHDGDSNKKFKFRVQKARSMRLGVSFTSFLKKARMSGFTLEVAAPFKPRVKQ